jgi:hypothetical protein
MVRAGLCALLACSMGVGCDGGSQKLEQTGKSVESWSATVRETASQWERGRVPRTYVRQIAKAADEELADEAEDLSKAPAGAKRDELNRKLSDLRRRVKELSGAVEGNDPRRARAIADGGNG